MKMCIRDRVYFMNTNYPKVELPVFPDKKFDITEFGAVEGGDVYKRQS